MATITKEDLMKNFSEALVSEIENVDKVLLPLLKVYVDNVRAVRMAIGSEVRDILREARNLEGISSRTEEILAFAKAVEQLKATLTPEVIEMIRKVMK
jgi:chorismate mutase